MILALLRILTGTPSVKKVRRTHYADAMAYREEKLKRRKFKERNFQDKKYRIYLQKEEI